jgi:hypothetical protein
MMKPNKVITLLDIKNAMKDKDFVEKLPKSLAPEIEKIQSNPGCGCNVKLYEKILNEAGDVINQYFPEKNSTNSVAAAVEAQQADTKSTVTVPQPVQPAQRPQLPQNNWTVINCSIGELESKLKALPPGRKQVTLSRYEDQVTVVINNLDLIF